MYIIRFESIAFQLNENDHTISYARKAKELVDDYNKYEARYGGSIFRWYFSEELEKARMDLMNEIGNALSVKGLVRSDFRVSIKICNTGNVSNKSVKNGFWPNDCYTDCIKFPIVS